MDKVFVFDPTAADEMSRVRGVGRYLQTLKECFGKNWQFISDLRALPKDSTLINPFFNFLAPPLIGQRIAGRQLAVIHDLIPLKYPTHFPAGLRGRINIFCNKRSLKLYNRFITDSQASKSDIVNILKIGEEKIHVVYPALGPSLAASIKMNMKNKSDTTAPLPEGLPNSYCIYAGDATWNKNLVNLAKAIREINVTCVFVGNVFKNTASFNHPWQKELKEFMALAEGDKRFIFPGYVPDKQLADLYRGARCNILVSRDEGFGYSLVEAAALATPSVLSDIDVFKEVAGDAALYANPGSATDIANQIGELYFNTDMRKTLGQKAAARSASFSIEKFSQALRRAIF